MTFFKSCNSYYIQLRVLAVSSCLVRHFGCIYRFEEPLSWLEAFLYHQSIRSAFKIFRFQMLIEPIDKCACANFDLLRLHRRIYARVFHYANGMRMHGTLYRAKNT